MTREEAWRRAKGYLYDILSGEEADEIIKALQQEPCEDAISRQAAIDACLNGWNKDYKEIVEEIRTLPPVKPQPKTGHWKKMVSIYDVVSGTYTRVTYTDEDKKMSNMPIYECECGRTMPMPTNYCPDCGAKMVEPQESEEE